MLEQSVLKQSMLEWSMLERKAAEVISIQVESSMLEQGMLNKFFFCQANAWVRIPSSSPIVVFMYCYRAEIQHDAMD